MSRKTPTDRHAGLRHAGMLALALLGTPCTTSAESLKDAWAMALQSDGGVAAARSDREAAPRPPGTVVRRTLRTTRRRDLRAPETP